MSSSIKTFLHCSAFSFIALAVAGLMNYLTRRYLSIHLSEYDFGLFYGMFAFISIAGSFAEFGVTQSGTVLFAEIAEHSDCEEKKETIFSTLFFFRLILCLIIFCTVLAVSPMIRKGFGNVPFLTLFLISLILLLQSFEGVFTAFWNGFKRFFITYAILILKTFLLFLFVVWLTPIFCLNGTCSAFLLAPVFTILICFVILFYLYGIRLRFSFFRKEIASRLLHLSGYLAVSVMLLNIIYHIGSVILIFQKGPESTSFYNIGLAFMQIVQISMAFPTIFLPFAVQLVKKERYCTLKKILFVAAGITLFLLPLTWLFFHLTAPRLIALLFTETYLRAAPAVTVLCCGLLFYTYSNFLAQILIAMEKMKALAVNTMTVTVLNVILNVILIYWFDFTGAAYASAATYFLLGLLNTLLLGRLIHKKLKEKNEP